MERIRRLFTGADEGQDIMEYGVLAAFLSVAAVAVVRAIGPLVLNLYQVVLDALT